MQPETRFKTHVRARLKTTLPGVWFFKNVAVSVRGIPDILGCHQGVFFALELKVGDNKPDKLQAHELKRISAAGGFAKVVYPHNFAIILEQLILFVSKRACNTELNKEPL